MNDTKKDLVIGVFEQEAQAEQAVSALWRTGFAPDRIDMANRRMGVVPGTPRLQFQKDAAEGADHRSHGGRGRGSRGGCGGWLPTARYWHHSRWHWRSRSGGCRRHVPRSFSRHGHFRG